MMPKSLCDQLVKVYTILIQSYSSAVIHLCLRTESYKYKELPTFAYRNLKINNDV